MKLKQTSCLAFLLGTIVASSTSKAVAESLYIPDGSFEGINSSVASTLLNLDPSGSIGAWSVQLNGINVGNSISAGTTNTLGGPAPTDGTYDVKIHMLIGLATSASLSQNLTNYWKPNSTYTLKFGVGKNSTLALLGNTTVSLNAGSTTMESWSGNQLIGLIDSSTNSVGLLNDSNNFQTIVLTYKTGNVVPAGVPANVINISFQISGLADVASDLYLDNFQLDVVPTQIQLTSLLAANNANITLNGIGGAPGQTYEILTTTNLAMTADSWMPITTNIFDTNGNFAIPVSVDRTAPCHFYKIKLP